MEGAPITRHSSLVIAIGLLLGALGWWLPWVVPRSGAAALVLLGLDLGDFWKFTREWRAGVFEWERLCFFLPPALAAMGLSLGLAGQRGWARWLLVPLLVFLSVVPLPAWEFVLPAVEAGNPLAYEFAALQSPARDTMQSLAREFTFQLRLAAASLLALLLLPLWQRSSQRGRTLLLAAVALAGAALPAWALWRTWLVLQGLYGGGATLGPGPLVTSGGFLLAALAACLSLANPHNEEGRRLKDEG